MDSNEYIVYNNGTKNVLRFPTQSPTSGYTIRVKFSTKWLITQDTSTLDDRDAQPLAALATSLCLRMLSAHWLQSTEPSMNIDVIDYTRKSVEANMLADNLENIYRDHIGIARIGERGKTEAPISAVTGAKDLDLEFPWKENYLTHPKTWR
jgi:hypothetical protein